MPHLSQLKRLEWRKEQNFLISHTAKNTVKIPSSQNKKTLIGLEIPILRPHCKLPFN